MLHRKHAPQEKPAEYPYNAALREFLDFFSAAGLASM
jgi:hypothetical protein